ncbi:class I SAM-dependent methyltransferase [Pontiellaceae bacterium B1224]|nr:class I SAM-dependent methyltransferase [Pontiellaceae bacterium B1224]
MPNRRDFDVRASEWDEHSPRVTMLGAIADTLASKVVLSPEMDVLDFGCGTGLLSLHLAANVASLTGVDNSAGMLEVFLQKAEQLGLKNVSALHLDLDKGEPLPGQYDLIVSSMAFHHIQHIEAVLQQFYAALKPGGMLCIADLDLDDGLFHRDPINVFHDGFDRRAFRSTLVQAGFADIRDVQAAEVTRSVAAGGTRRFTIFLMSGRKEA